VDGNRIEKIVVNFVERPSPRRENDELRAPEDDLE
jgi:hypothetical protein